MNGDAFVTTSGAKIDVIRKRKGAMFVLACLDDSMQPPWKAGARTGKLSSKSAAKTLCTLPLRLPASASTNGAPAQIHV